MILGLSIEVFEKACRGERILPLTTQHDCVLLYNDDHFELIEKQEKIRQLSELRRQAKSAQRRRNFNPKNFIVSFQTYIFKKDIFLMFFIIMKLF